MKIKKYKRYVKQVIIRENLEEEELVPEEDLYISCRRTALKERGGGN